MPELSSAHAIGVSRSAGGACARGSGPRASARPALGYHRAHGHQRRSPLATQGRRGARCSPNLPRRSRAFRVRSCSTPCAPPSTTRARGCSRASRPRRDVARGRARRRGAGDTGGAAVACGASSTRPASSCTPTWAAACSPTPPRRRSPRSRPATRRSSTTSRAGERGSRHVARRELLCRLTGAEAAMAVNNNAAAVMLAIAGLARGREAIVSRAASSSRSAAASASRTSWPSRARRWSRWARPTRRTSQTTSGL